MDSYTRLLNSISANKSVTSDMIELEFNRGLITSQEYEILLNYKKHISSQTPDYLGLEAELKRLNRY